MSLDKETVRKIARLARIETSEGDLEAMVPKLNGILKWIEQLGEVDTKNVEPLANVANIELKLRKDEVSDGNCQNQILANAPEKTEGFYVVPKVVE